MEEYKLSKSSKGIVTIFWSAIVMLLVWIAMVLVRTSWFAIKGIVQMWKSN